MSSVKVARSRKDLDIPLFRKSDRDLISEEVKIRNLLTPRAYDLESKLFELSDQSLGFGFLCEPLSGFSVETEAKVHTFLNQQYPDNTCKQILLFKSPDVNSTVGAMTAMRDGSGPPLAKEVVRSRREFLEQHTREPLLMKDMEGGQFNLGRIHDTKLLITVKLSNADIRPTEAEFTRMVELQARTQGLLSTIGLRPQALTADGYLRFMRVFLNWGDSASWRRRNPAWDQEKLLSEQVLDYETDIEIQRKSLRIGDVSFKVLCAKELPESGYFGDSMAVVGNALQGRIDLKVNHAICLNIHYPNIESRKKDLNRKRSFVVNQAVGPLEKFIPVLGMKKGAFDTLYKSMENGSRPISVSYTVLLMAPQEEPLEAIASGAIASWDGCKFKLLDEPLIKMPVLLNNLPFGMDVKAIDDLARYLTITSEELLPIIPLFSDWKGTGTPTLILQSRNGQIMPISLQDSATNQNAIIAAESGAGKSFLANELILAYLSLGAQVWVIDAGKSYLNLCNQLDGDFLSFGLDDDICLNPYPLVDNFDEDEDTVNSLIATMASPSSLLSELQLAELRRINADEYRKHGPDTEVDHIAAACLNSPDPRVMDIGKQLYPFRKGGSYSRYVTGKPNINFKNNFTVLELDELQGRRHLRQVVLLQLIFQIQQAVYFGDRSRLKLVIVDEAWDLLKDGRPGQFMEHAYRKFRKYGGSIGIATQSVADLYTTDSGRAIVENSGNMFLLRQKGEAISRMRKEDSLAIGDVGYDVLQSVTTVPGVYSEIFVKSSSGMGIGRLAVTEYQNLLYSTHPKDVSAIQKYKQKGLPLDRAIRAVIDERSRQYVEGA